MEYNAKKSNYCFWDKHIFQTEGVMCPVFYKPKQIVRKKGDYSINQNVSKNEKILENKISTNKEEILYDDMFCSYECCLAWIEDNHTNPKYKNSKYILYNVVNKEIKKSLHWKLLKNFGGFLSIEEFRKNNINYVYVDSHYENNIYTESFTEMNDVC